MKIHRTLRKSSLSPSAEIQPLLQYLFSDTESKFTILQRPRWRISSCINLNLENVCLNFLDGFNNDKVPLPTLREREKEEKGREYKI